MSTLLEIEQAVSSLPPSDQQELLQWLQGIVDDSSRESNSASGEVDPAWLNELAQRRRRGMTGVSGTPVQTIVDELRGDR